ncbi:MAG: hypothetical protein ABIR30_10335 [Chitinophagaceae bacterium]
MRKLALFFVVLLGLLPRLSAQAYESTVQFDKKKQPAIAIDYSYPPEAVENAIIKKMERLGYKGKEEKGFLNKDKGFLLFKNAYITDISKDRLDYIVKVERKSRKASDESELYMIMMKNDENALGKLSAFDIGKAKSFLNELIPDIEEAHLEIQIRDQEDAVTKSEKKLKGLQEDKLELDKKYEANLKSQEETVKDIEEQKKNLDTLRARRKRS